jgi:hypothetical protein
MSGNKNSGRPVSVTPEKVKLIREVYSALYILRRRAKSFELPDSTIRRILKHKGAYK